MKFSTVDLRSLPDFSEVPEDQLSWFIDHSDLVQIKVGDKIFKMKDPIDKLYVVLEGCVEVKLKRANNFRTIGLIQRGGISGFLPYSRATTAIAEGVVSEEGYILVLSKDKCREMSLNHYELTAVFVHEMTSRTREFTKSNLQAEKMMALGKLSAGLAHELNNPASAILRSAKDLKKHLGNVPEKFKAVMSMKISVEQVDILNDLISQKMMEPVTLSLSERSSLEEELEDWLMDNANEDCLDIVDGLVEYNFSTTDLDKILSITGKRDLHPSLNWINNVLTTEKMVDEIEEASDRISELVKSVKIYTHMDSAPAKQRADIGKGIQSTITMLNHKLKRKSILVDIDLESELNEPCIMINEINQVWTNLIDNAIDAMEMNGTLKITGRNDLDHVVVEIIDSGHGISKENMDRIFDPFFTTKGVGEGTGMGLEVVHRIIEQHKGSIDVNSEPGQTKFIIRLPID